MDFSGAGPGVRPEVLRAIDQAMKLARAGAVADVREMRLRGGSFSKMFEGR
jgi:hypothetical protein